MTAEQLLLAIGEINEETVLAADRPRKQPVPHLWVAVTAVAAAVVIGVLGFVGLLQSQQNKPPVGDPIPPAVTSVVPSTTTQPNGTGGDYDACKVHSFEYHNIDGNLIDYVTSERFEEFRKIYDGENMTIFAFVDYFNVTREQFIEAMKWEGTLTEQMSEHEPYTRGMYVDAIFGDDATLTEWLFSGDIMDEDNYPPVDVMMYEGDCATHQAEYHRIPAELFPLVTHRRLLDYLKYYGCMGESANIVTFVAYCEISREEYIRAMGWEDVLDQTATAHGSECAYTYGEFVDAIYGGDAFHRQRIFARS